MRMYLLQLLALASAIFPLACSSSASSGTGGIGGQGGSSGNGGGAASSGSGITCVDGKAACGSACADLSADAVNCGGCGYACQSGATCCQGACGNDCSFTITEVSPAQGPMSGGTWLKIVGQGFTLGARVTVGGSRAPARVIDSQTIVALTPPGLANKVDVRVDQGPTYATRGGAFEYASYGLEGTWQKINMSSPRGNWPGIAVEQDGRVLISGGVATSMGTSVLDTADLYDPMTQTTKPTVGKMSAPRWTQASVTLLTGKTLVLGTWFGGFAPPGGPIADLFDVQSTTFKPTAGKPAIEHHWPHAVLLADGRVLIVGYDPGPANMEIYDPAKDAFLIVPNAPDCMGYRPTRLLDGRVLLVKGGNAPNHLYNPETGTFSDVGLGPTAMDGDLHTLPDGRVLYVLGSIVDLAKNMLLATDKLEIFDPGKAMQGFHLGTWTGTLSAPRQRTLTTAMAGDGAVLVLGGEIGMQTLNPGCANNSFMLTNAVDQIDALSGQIHPFLDGLPEENFVMSAATTLDGSIVAAGGAPCGGGMAYPYFYFLKGSAPVPK